MNKIYQAWLFLGCTFLSNSVFSAEDKLTLSQPIEPSSYLTQIMLSLVFILGIIFVGAWLLKRFGRVNGIANDQMRVMANMAVGQRERVILLEVGKEQLLIGVTASKVSLLHELKEPIVFDDPPPSVIKGGFAEKLQEAVTQFKSKKSGESL